MKKLLLAFLFLASLTVAPLPASAACAGGTCFGIAAGNWGTNGTWSVLSGGVSCVCTPATGDAIVLDANSGSGTYTMEAAYSILSLVTTGFTGTLTQNAFTMTVTGNTFTLVSGMTYTPSSGTRIVAFTSTSGTTVITSAGKTFGALTLNGTGGTFQFADALSVRADGILTYTAGTFDASTNNVAVTVGAFSATGSGTRTFKAGTNTWTINAVTGSVWDFTGTNITVTTPSTDMPGTLLISATPTGSRAVSLGTSRTYNTITLASGGSTAFDTTFNGVTALAIATWNITAPNVVRYSSAAAVTYTVTNALTWAGSSSSSVALMFANAAVLTITAPASALSFVALGNLTFTNASTATSSFDLKGNTGITITGPSGGSGGRIIGGWLLNRDLVPSNDNGPAFLNKAA